MYTQTNVYLAFCLPRVLVRTPDAWQLQALENDIPLEGQVYIGLGIHLSLPEVRAKASKESRAHYDGMVRAFEATRAEEGASSSSTRRGQEGARRSARQYYIAQRMYMPLYVWIYVFICLSLSLSLSLYIYIYILFIRETLSSYVCIYVFICLSLSLYIYIYNVYVKLSQRLYFVVVLTYYFTCFLFCFRSTCLFSLRVVQRLQGYGFISFSINACILFSCLRGYTSIMFSINVFVG